MKFEIPTNQRNTKKTTSIIRGQRSSCVVQVFRYDKTDITKLVALNAKDDTTFVGKSRSSSGNLAVREPLTIRNDVIHCTINKSKTGIDGNFSLTLKKGNSVKGTTVLDTKVDYAQMIHPGDWVAIYLKKNGNITSNDLSLLTSASGLKFLGIVENVRFSETDSVDRGTPKLEYTVTGREFGKVFDTSIYFNPTFNEKTIASVLGAKFNKDSTGVIKPIGGNKPNVVVKKIMKFFLGGEGSSSSNANDNWYIPLDLSLKFHPPTKNKVPGMAFTDILDFSQIGMHRYANGIFNGVYDLAGACLIKAIPSSGTIWSVMQFLQNNAINEMYTELVPDKNGNLKPAVVLRQLPFSNKSSHETNVFQANKKYNSVTISDGISDTQKTYFADLPRHNIISSDILNKDVGKSDHERINYIMVVPKIDSSTFNIAHVAGINVPSVQRYGLKIFQAQTSYVLDSAEQGIKKYCERCVYLLQDWFFLAHNLYNGTITVDGRDEHVPVGTNLYLTDAQQLFHIEGYTHNYQISPSGEIRYTTEFKVSRGQTLNGSLTKFIAPASGSLNPSTDPTTVTVSFLQNNRRTEDAKS